jgi:hypothetical protein
MELYQGAKNRVGCNPEDHTAGNGQNISQTGTTTQSAQHFRMEINKN